MARGEWGGKRQLEGGWGTDGDGGGGGQNTSGE